MGMFLFFSFKLFLLFFIIFSFKIYYYFNDYLLNFFQRVNFKYYCSYNIVHSIRHELNSLIGEFIKIKIGWGR